MKTLLLLVIALLFAGCHDNDNCNETAAKATGTDCKSAIERALGM